MAAEPIFTPYTIVEGDRFDTVSRKAYGDSDYMEKLFSDNPHLQIRTELPPGEIMYVRIKVDPITGELLPPWFLTDEEVKIDGTDPEQTIPVVDTLPTALAFSPGYPRVVNNTIEFAITQQTQLPYSVEKINGFVVKESSGYDFTPGFPVKTGVLPDSGYYIVKVGSLVSQQLTIVGAETPMAFSQAPTVTKTLLGWDLKYGINKTGAYDTRVINTDTQAALYNQIGFDYTKDAVYTIPLTSAGPRKLTVGTLEFLFSLFAVTETDELQDWLLGIKYRYDAGSHDTTFLTNSPGYDLEMNIKAVLGANPSGINQDGAPWNELLYNDGRNDYIPAGSTERFSFNASTVGNGGLLPNVQYKIRVRRKTEPGDVFFFLFTTPTVSTGLVTPEDIELEEPLNNCTFGPTLTAINSFSNATLNFTFDGIDVYAILWEAELDEEVVRTATVQIANPDTGEAFFTPSWKPTVSFSPPLGAGDYLFKIQGGSCSSAVTSLPFTIVGDVDPDPEPPIGDGTYTPVLARIGLPTICNIVVTGVGGSTSENWVLNDLATPALDSGKKWRYYLDGVLIAEQTGPLTNFPYQCNEPFMIEKLGMKTGVIEFRWVDTGNNQYIPGFSDPNAGQTYPLNASGGFTEIGFKPN